MYRIEREKITDICYYCLPCTACTGCVTLALSRADVRSMSFAVFSTCCTNRNASVIGAMLSYTFRVGLNFQCMVDPVDRKNVSFAGGFSASRISYSVKKTFCCPRAAKR